MYLSIDTECTGGGGGVYACGAVRVEIHGFPVPVYAPFELCVLDSG